MIPAFTLSTTTVINLAGKAPFARPDGAALLEGRAARIKAVASFNNVCEIAVVKAVFGDEESFARIEGYRFDATHAVARGVALETGLFVFHLGFENGRDRFIACNARGIVS